MKKRFPRAYFLIFFSVLALMSIPKESTQKLQGQIIAILAPIWQHLLAFNSLFSIAQGNDVNQSDISIDEVEKLRLENALLKEEIIYIKDVMQQEMRIISHLNATLEDRVTTKNLKDRHRQELKKLLETHLEAVPARVIFRSPGSWNSSFWINVGSQSNKTLGKATIAKNSPVLLGTTVIGVIDYVGKHQARVRLITDSGLTPSVRAVRGGIQSKVLDEKLHALLTLLKTMPEALDNMPEQLELIERLESAASHLLHDKKTSYLAKGELYGSSKSLWRTQRHELRGIGFNYDFADDEGPARDLRTGKRLSDDRQADNQPIVKTGDLLVTTGMDGVFPAGLMVAEVTHVHPLKEGDYYYELDALPIAGNFDDLAHVFVIPPVNYDPDEIPPSFGWK